jgi:hypothetical protein
MKLIHFLLPLLLLTGKESGIVMTDTVFCTHQVVLDRQESGMDRVIEVEDEYDAGACKKPG